MRKFQHHEKIPADAGIFFGLGAPLNRLICRYATHELDETLTVTLTTPGNATLGTATATGTITNDLPKNRYPLNNCSNTANILASCN